ncbi:MAG: hypothetical protein ACOYOK_14955 [Pseudobdellovibrionaceae bacterium]
MHKIGTLTKISTATFLLYSSISVAQSSNYACKAQADKNAVVATQSQRLNDFAWASNTKNLIFIGDEHNKSNPVDISTLINQIKNQKDVGGKNCLFLEFPSSMSVEEFKKILSDPNDNVETLSYRRYYGAILNTGEASGFKVMLADHPQYFESEKTMNERDEAIAKNIFTAFQNKTCDLGIMVVGKAHLAPDEEGRFLVRDNLKSLGFESTAINLQYANERVTLPRFKSWNGICPEKPTPISSPVIFKNGPIADHSVYPLYTSLMKIGYFDLTVLFPQ